MFQIAYDRASKTLNLRLSGFWTRDTMDRFLRQFGAEVAHLARAKIPYVVLSDCRDYPVQSTEILHGWSRVLGPVPMVDVPYAVVVPSMLNKLQAERCLTAPNVRVFSDMDDALEWLSAAR